MKKRKLQLNVLWGPRDLANAEADIMAGGDGSSATCWVTFKCLIFGKTDRSGQPYSWERGIWLGDETEGSSSEIGTTRRLVQAGNHILPISRTW